MCWLQVCLQKEVLIARDQLCQEVYLLMRGAMQVSSGDEASTSGAMMFRMVEKPGSIIGHIDPFQREVRAPPNWLTLSCQHHAPTSRAPTARDLCTRPVHVYKTLARFSLRGVHVYVHVCVSV